MRRLSCAALLLAACAPNPRTAAEPKAGFTLGNVTVTPLAPGVYAAIRREPLALAVNSNSLFIVNSDHVVVVDAQFTRVATREQIAALRRITRLPVRYVINTHWHDDHLAGNQVYQDSFPGVQFLAHANTREDLIARGRPNREGQVRFAPPAADRMERLLSMGLGPDSTPATPMERESVASALRIIRQYLAEQAGYREVLPDSGTGALTVLAEGGRRIEIHWFGRANTRGDVVTWLPREGIASSGDLLVAPMPFAFGSYPSEWIAVLDSLRALHPRVIVPGHGPVMRDLSYLSQVRRMLALARDSAYAARARGVPADSVVALVRLDQLRDELAGSEKWLRWAFGYFFRTPAVMRAYEEAGGPLK